MDSVTTRAWMGLISQRSRLLRIDTPLPDALQVERLSGREAVCEGFRFEVDCISTSAFLDLRALLGREVGVTLARPQGRATHWHGLVTQARRSGADGGLARYRLVLEPWLALLAHRRNALVFQDCDARGVLERVFADYPQANVRFDLTLPLRTHPIRTQFRETDLDFVLRVMAEDGLSWFVEHDAEAPAGGQARHRLVVFDRRAECEPGDPAQVRFHRVDATEAHDAISEFGQRLSMVPESVTTASWAFGQLTAVSGSAECRMDDPAGLDIFDAGHARRFDTADAATQAAAARLAALQVPGELYAGAGSLRGLAAGKGFTLLQHDSWGGRRYRPLVVQHEAANNLGSELANLLQATDVERGSYRNRFVCAPAEVAPLPLPRARPTAPGPQTARVVGLPDHAVTSNRDHQVRIQFPWQRGTTPLRGGLDHVGSSAHPEGHAPGDDRSGTWVRVAEAIAGANWGTHFLPRIGSEVLVEFEHGDVDRPVIVGQLYNGANPPPLAAGEGGTANHIGVLSGVRTEGLDGRNPQSWVVDDASGQLRQRVETSLADTRLELGYLVDQAGARRGPCRGSGFELQTHGWGRLHADGGLLVSTTAREDARSTQMDAEQALGQVRAARSTSTHLADAATARGVPATRAAEAIDTLLEHLDPGKGAAFDGPVGGQPSGKPAPGSREPDAPTERFAQPQLVLEAPSDIALASVGTMALTAGEHVSLTCHEDLHLAAAHTIAFATAESAALSAQEGPLRVIAAKGPLSLHAHTDALELLADESVSLTSTDESIEILAKERIELRVGNSAITLCGGDVTLACAGRFTAKGAVHPFSGAASQVPTLQPLAEATNHTQANKETLESYSEAPCPEECVVGALVFPTSSGDFLVSRESFELVLSFESYQRFPYVPAGDTRSGITLGYGYDIGHQSESAIRAELAGIYSEMEIESFVEVAGTQGDAARNVLGKVATIGIEQEDALELARRTKGRFARSVVGIYPQVQHLHPHCRGALLSLVYNRGTALGSPANDSRREMREIRDLLASNSPEGIPAAIRSMKRLWENKGLGGLLKRRDAEADLFEKGLQCDCWQ